MTLYSFWGEIKKIEEGKVQVALSPTCTIVLEVGEEAKDLEPGLKVPVVLRLEAPRREEPTTP